MNIFISMKDSLWDVISSIATAAGVLVALLLPIWRRRSEKKNLIYFQAKSLRLLLDDIKYIKDLKVHSTDENEKSKLIAKQFLDIKIPNLEDAKEIAKYDIKLYEAISGIIEELQSVQSSAKHILESNDPTYMDLDRKWFDSCVASLSLKVIFSSDYLSKKKIVGKYWTFF